MNRIQQFAPLKITARTGVEPHAGVQLFSDDDLGVVNIREAGGPVLLAEVDRFLKNLTEANKVNEGEASADSAFHCPSRSSRGDETANQ